MATIGALVAELSADTAAFHRDLGKATAALNSHAAKMNKSIAGMEKAFGELAKVISVTVVAMAMVRLAKAQIDLGDQLLKTSQKIGISVEQLSAYQYAADLSGNSNEQLTTSLTKLTRNMQDAARNGAGEAAYYFKALGIAVTDSSGQLRNSGAVLEDIARIFENMPDGPEKTAIAVKLLGKSGAEMIPLLNNFRELNDEAQRTGNIVSTQFAKDAEAFNDHVTRMNKSLGNLTRTILMEFLPGLNEMIERFNVFTGAQANLSLQTAEKMRARLINEYQALKQLQENNSMLGGLGGRSLEGIRKEIDALDEIIIKENQRKQIKEAAQKAGAGRSPLTGFRSENFLRLQEEIQKSTSDLLQSTITDEAVKAQMRIDTETKVWRRKIEILGKGTAERKEIEADFLKWQEAAYMEAAYRSRTPLQVLLDNWRDVTKQMQDATARWAQSGADALTEFAMTGKLNFKDFANSIIRDLLRIQIQSQLAGMAKLFGGGGGIGGFLASGFSSGGLAGARAAGGPVSAGSSYLVGERGPEVFTPHQSGRIIPNGGGGETFITIDARGQDPGVVMRIEQALRNLDATIEHRAVAAVMDERQRGGRFTGAFGG